jgi:hypothetical protein
MVNAFSFCLFGPTSGIYHRGFLENVEIIKNRYPGWVVYVYLAPDTDSGFIAHCRTLPTVRIRFTTTLGFDNTIWRFYAIDEPDVEVCFFRDADSRVHWKDRWAIDSFINSNGFKAHVIRDHKEHTAMIAAGMWGLRKGVIPSICALYEQWTPIFAGNGDPADITGFGIDQNFLTRCIYPLIQSSMLLHYSNNCIFLNETGIEFPFTWSNDIYCGRQERNFVDAQGPRKMGLRLPSVVTKISR